MDCAHLRILVDRYLDREIDPDASMSIARHLGVCADCSRTVSARSSMRTAIKKDAGYYRARPALADRIRLQVGGTTRQAAPAVPRGRFKLPEWRRWLHVTRATRRAAPTLPRRGFKLPESRRWLPMGAAVAATVLATNFATFQLASVRGDEMLVAQLISSRSRSIVTGHPIDVASSDQHTVKPWLSSKLDFSPSVTDLSEAGFPLRGGRLEYLNDRLVAVLVYEHGQHLIDLFVWPADSVDKASSRTLSKRGVNVLHWTTGGMTYWAVSDVPRKDLQEFAERYASVTRTR
jgi:anti-sigma factor RsiW